MDVKEIEKALDMERMRIKNSISRTRSEITSRYVEIKKLRAELDALPRVRAKVKRKKKDATNKEAV